MSQNQLLPKTTTDFADPLYWKNFFAQRKTPFEWYGDYGNLGPVLEKYLKPSDKILQLGCGNSQLASQMYDSGFRHVHSIDMDASVIDEQRRKNRERTELSFEKDDATSLSSGDDTVSVVVDKGTLDALLPPSADQQQKSAVESMFNEVARVLQAGGRYIIITLAQEHLVEFWLQHFSKSNQFLLRAHAIPTNASGFPMPVFFLIATKFRMAMPTALPVEFLRVGAASSDRLASASHLVPNIAAEQELSRFIHLCSSKLDSEVSINVEGKDGDGPRYRIFILDDANAKELKSYDVFIVPIGRDCDWIFATEKGRRSLRAQVKSDRLMMVFLMRGHSYESLEAVKDELGGFASRFDPRASGERINFLTMGETDVRRGVASGESAVNGKWAVEDVVVSEKEYRRLVFLASQNLVQSEAPLRAGKKGKKVVDLDNLSCEHHLLMLSSLALLRENPLMKPETSPLNVAILGLGGGLLASFIVRQFPKSKVAGVDLDDDVVKIGSQYFSFPSTNPRMTVSVMDARDYLADSVARGDKLDVLLVDVAGSMHDDGLSCPPACFLEKKVLENMRDCLQPHGVLALNLVTRDEEVAARARKTVREVFPLLFSVSSDEDLNEVLVGVRGDLPKSLDVKKLSRSLPSHLPWLLEVGEWVGKIKRVQ